MNIILSRLQILLLISLSFSAQAGNSYVQTGAFSLQVDAEQMAGRIKSMGYNARVIAEKYGNDAQYFIRIANLNETDARDMCNVLSLNNVPCRINAISNNSMAGYSHGSPSARPITEVLLPGAQPVAGVLSQNAQPVTEVLLPEARPVTEVLLPQTQTNIVAPDNFRAGVGKLGFR